MIRDSVQSSAGLLKVHIFRCFQKINLILCNSDIIFRITFIIKVRRGSGFDEMFCIFANMSCLCIHLVTLFNLPWKKKIVMEFFFMS